MLGKTHKFRLFLAFFICSLLLLAAVPRAAQASHAQCKDDTPVPESVTDPGAAAAFCGGRGGLDSSEPWLCVNGNFSSTNDGCAAQGSANVTNAEVASNCRDEDTQEARASCAASGSGSSGSSGNFEADCKSGNLNKDNCGIIAYIVLFTRVLSGLVGIVVVIMIAVGGIQYAAAGPDPSAVVAARKRIINALIALVFYIFMFSFLQWLVPGGIF